MAVVVMCDECGAVVGPIDRLADAGPPPHRCEACQEALDWEADAEALAAVTTQDRKARK